MLQDFLNCIKIKFEIHDTQKRPPYFKEGEVWWCNFGQNIGDEQNGKGLNFMRPVFGSQKIQQKYLSCSSFK